MDSDPAQVLQAGLDKEDEWTHEPRGMDPEHHRGPAAERIRSRSFGYIGATHQIPGGSRFGVGLVFGAKVGAATAGRCDSVIPPWLSIAAAEQRAEVKSSVVVVV